MRERGKAGEHPCERCACKGECSSAKKCIRWRRWFKERWKECVESLRSSVATAEQETRGEETPLRTVARSRSSRALAEGGRLRPAGRVQAANPPEAGSWAVVDVSEEVRALYGSESVQSAESVSEANQEK